MFTSLVLRLSPTENAVLPPFSGHFAYSAVLKMLPENLSNQWHAENVQKPFTVSSLLGTPKAEKKGVFLKSSKEYFLRITIVDADAFGVVLQKLWEQKKIILGAQTFEIKSIDTQPLQHPWAFFLTFDEWEEKARKGGETIFLHFTSPTAFRSGEKKLFILPDPEKIFASLAQKASQLKLLEKPERLDLGQAVWVSRLENINTHVFEMKQNFYRGFGGKIWMEMRTDKKEWQQYLWKLALLAPFLGVGTKTTMGMGQVQKNF